MTQKRRSREAIRASWAVFWDRLEAEAEPTEIPALVKAEIARRVGGARDHVHPGSEPDVALVRIFADPVLLDRLCEATARFINGSVVRRPFRQGHLREITDSLERAESELRELMDRVLYQAEMLADAAIAFRNVPGMPDDEQLALAHADAWFAIGFLDALKTVEKVACNARTVESAVLAAHGPDEGSIPLASTLQGDERDRLIADLAAIWRSIGGKIPCRDEPGREPFRDFVVALHASIGAGEMPEKDLTRLIRAVAN